MYGHVFQNRPCLGAHDFIVKGVVVDDLGGIPDVGARDNGQGMHTNGCDGGDISCQTGRCAGVVGIESEHTGTRTFVAFDFGFTGWVGGLHAFPV